MTKPKRFYISDLKSLYGEEVSGHEDTHGWLCFDSFETEGDTFEELLDNCSGFTMDQDGGEAFEVHFDDLPVRLQRILQCEIEDRVIAKRKEHSNE